METTHGTTEMTGRTLNDLLNGLHFITVLLAPFSPPLVFDSLVNVDDLVHPGIFNTGFVQSQDEATPAKVRVNAAAGRRRPPGFTRLRRAAKSITGKTPGKRKLESGRLSNGHSPDPGGLFSKTKLPRL